MPLPLLPLLVLACTGGKDPSDTGLPDSDPFDTGAPDDTASDDGVPYSNDDYTWTDLVPPVGTRWTYRDARNDFRFPAEIRAPQEFDGATWSVFGLGDLSSTSQDRGVLLYDATTPWEIGLKRLTWYLAGMDDPVEDYVLDSPIVFPFVDVPGAYRTTTGVATLGDQTLDVTVTSTLLELDTTVDLPVGAREHARHYRVDVEVGFNLTMEVWFHPEIGLVRTTDFLGGAALELVEFIPVE